MADPVALTCDNCECYKRRHADDAAHEAAEKAGHQVSRGLCWRYPAPLARQHFDSCGEHSELAKRRLRYLAHQIAMSLQSGEKA